MSPTELNGNKDRVYNDDELSPIKEELQKKGYVFDFDFLGRGNWGEVYKIEHSGLKCNRAVKILLPEYLENKQVRSRFLDEALRMTSLSHNHIVNIFDLGSPNNMSYYVMEFVINKEFKIFLDTNDNLECEDYLILLHQLCDVLWFIHKNNMVHLDIKSENVLVDPDLKAKGIKLSDFGLSHYLIGSSYPKYDGPDIPWLPPSLNEYRGKEIPRSAFKPSQDLAYFGKMLKELNFKKYVESKFSMRQKILLDKLIDDLYNEKISEAKLLSEQLCKLSTTHPPTGGIPELAASLAIDSHSTIRIPPNIIVPTTKRILNLLEQPEFQRLRRVRQLGPTSLIYPGAKHTRFEHSLGAYSLAVRYLNHLLTDPEFDYLFNQNNLVTLLVAVLLHDIGHYPFSHNLEEMELAEFPEHRLVTCRILDGTLDSILSKLKSQSKLAKIIEEEFKVDISEVIKIIYPNYFGDATQSPKEKI